LPPEGDSFETDETALTNELADVDTNEEILQQIASNLDAFKQNQELMDQLKESKPELYASILGLLQNMIELAKMINPESDPNMAQPQEMDEDQQVPEQAMAPVLPQSQENSLGPK
jgi:hypothetical protein